MDVSCFQQWFARFKNQPRYFLPLSQSELGHSRPMLPVLVSTQHLFLKALELLLELTLQTGCLTCREVLLTRAECFTRNRDISCALGDRSELPRIGPQAPTGQERVLKARPGHRFELDIPEPVIFGCF